VRVAAAWRAARVLEVLMVSRRVVALGLLVGALAGCGRGGGRAAAGASPAIPWESDLAGALSRAASENKLVMIEFYTDWCGWCEVMEQKTFADAAVREQLGRLVVVKLDADRGGRDAARRYRVNGFPTTLFLDAQGQEVGRVPGFLPPQPFLEELADILRQG
jgi:thiol:disulfide interchange protein